MSDPYFVVSFGVPAAAKASLWTADSIHHYASTFQAIVTALSLIVAGVWGYLRFVLQAERYAHIQTAAELVLIAQQGDNFVIEVAAILENKGRVEHSMRSITFDLNGIKYGDEIETDERWGGQVRFGQNIAKGSFLPKGWHRFFIGPGLTARYSWIAKVPVQASIINVHCTFIYDDRYKSQHTMEATLSLAAANAKLQREMSPREDTDGKSA